MTSMNPADMRTTSRMCAVSGVVVVSIGALFLPWLTASAPAGVGGRTVTVTASLADAIESFGDNGVTAVDWVLGLGWTWLAFAGIAGAVVWWAFQADDHQDPGPAGLSLVLFVPVVLFIWRVYDVRETYQFELITAGINLAPGLGPWVVLLGAALLTVADFTMVRPTSPTAPSGTAVGPSPDSPTKAASPPVAQASPGPDAAAAAAAAAAAEQRRAEKAAESERQRVERERRRQQAIRAELERRGQEAIRAELERREQEAAEAQAAEMAREAERLKAQELRQALEVWNRDRVWRSGTDGSVTPPATPPLIGWLEPEPTPETEPPAPQAAPPLVADDHTSTVEMRTVQLDDGTNVRQVFVDGAWRDIT